MNDYYFDKLKRIRDDHLCMDDWNEALFGALRTLKQAVEASETGRYSTAENVRGLEQRVKSLETTVRCAHTEPEPVRQHGWLEPNPGVSAVMCTCGEVFYAIGKRQAAAMWARHMQKAGAL